MSASNRVAVVTGASRGLGAVIARTLVAQGYDLVLGARDPDPLDEVARALAVRGTRAVPVAGDVTDAAVRARLVEAAGALGGLDVLVNNASELGLIGPLMQFDVQRFGRVFPVNAGAPIALIQSAAPLLAARRGHAQQRVSRCA